MNTIQVTDWWKAEDDVIAKNKKERREEKMKGKGDIQNKRRWTEESNSFRLQVLSQEFRTILSAIFVYMYSPFQKSLHKIFSKFLNEARAFCATRSATSHASFYSSLKWLSNEVSHILISYQLKSGGQTKGKSHLSKKSIFSYDDVRL